MNLTNQELELKKMYQTTEGRGILSKPLRYEEYRQIIKVHPEYVDLGEFYAERTKANRGNTIADVGEIEAGEEITVQRHERYGYPILHNHAYIEMAYVYSGVCTHFVGEQSFQMEEGDLCILAPNATHVITALQDDAVILNILASKEVVNRAFLQMVKEKHLLAEFFENVLYGKQVSPYIIFPTGQDEWMHRLILTMYQEAHERRYAYKESLELYVRQMFIHIVRDYEVMAQVTTPLDQKLDDHIVSVLGYISVNYNQVTLKQLAEFFNYSEAYMSRLLKKYTGKTFGVLVTELQMKHASEMLVKTEKELKDIAQEVGCFDYSHFSRKFKKAFGESPDAYRKNRSKIYIEVDR